MSLADDLATCTNHPSRPCLTGQWLNSLDKRDVDAVREWISEGGHLSTLYNRSVRHGFDGGLTTFKAHFRESCSCFRGGVR